MGCLHPADIAAEDLGAQPVSGHQTPVPEADLAVGLKALPQQASHRAGEGTQAGHIKDSIVATNVCGRALQ